MFLPENDYVDKNYDNQERGNNEQNNMRSSSGSSGLLSLNYFSSDLVESFLARFATMDY